MRFAFVIFLLAASVGHLTIVVGDDFHAITKLAGFPRIDQAAFEESESIHINGNGNFLIERKLFRPRDGRYAIRIDNHASGTIVIRNCLFLGGGSAAPNGLSDSHGRGILAWQSSNIEIDSCQFQYVQGFCVRIVGSESSPSRNVQVTRNQMISLQAYFDHGTPWGWLADGIQFIDVHGPGNRIAKNICINRPKESYLTDFINVYCSSGTEESPLAVEANTLVGAGTGGLYNQYGCGIQLNDHSETRDGGEFVVARNNLLIDPGTVGININGGYKAKIVDNVILMSNRLATTLADAPQKETNTWAAITLFNYSAGVSRDSDHEVRFNRVGVRDAEGVVVAFVNKTNPANTVIADNDWNHSASWSDLLADRVSDAASFISNHEELHKSVDHKR